jgi:sodium-dependent dicarboxylate transporter 2/3/5
MKEDTAKPSGVRFWIAGIGLTAALALGGWVDLEPGQPHVTRAAAVAVAVGVLWLTEVIPLAVTALIPLVLFPLLGVDSGESIAREYAQDVIFVFMGGFLIALAMERWNLHRRIALFILSRFGSSPRRLVLGFLIATAALSMWISNTAAAMMMVTIALAVLQTADDRLPPNAAKRVGLAILLAIAYGATIGGVATPVGTPPNLVFLQMFRSRFPDGPPISFLRWMLFAVPISVVLSAAVWGLLARWVVPAGLQAFMPPGALDEAYRRQGRTRFAEWVVMVTFGVLVLLWLTRSTLQIGDIRLFGWSEWFDEPKFITDGTVSIAMALVLFAIPSRSEQGGMVLDWETAKRIPWHIILLLGGGFALARGIDQSGLSAWLGGQLEGFGALPVWLFLLLMCAGICCLSEFTSNTATTQLILPILIAMSIRLQIHPLLLMIPATVACSWGFMMPVGTPPNAIVFGTGRFRIVEMARVGILVNVMAVVLTVLVMMTWGKWIWQIDGGAMPTWAR